MVNVIDEVYFYDVKDSATWTPIWAPGEEKISEDGNEIVIKRVWEEKGASTIRTFTLIKK
jgi:hypothetical protein